MNSTASNIPTNEQFLAIVGISKELCLKMKTEPLFSTFNINISVHCYSSLIILDEPQVGHKLLFDVTG